MWLNGRRIGRAHFIDQRANALDARIVVGLAEIDGAADLRVHFCAAQFFGGSFLADGGLHQRGAGEKKAGAFGHQDVIAHHREVGAAGHAHAHDGGDLRDAHGAHHRIVAEDAAEIVGVGENVFLQRQKNAGGIDQINRGNVIFDGDILRANDFFRGHGEKRAGFYGGVVGDEHEGAAADSREAGDGSRAGCAAPFLVHFVSGVNAQARKNASRDRSASRCVRAPVRRPFLCCDSMAFAPPPGEICSSSFLSWVRRSMMRR